MKKRLLTFSVCINSYRSILVAIVILTAASCNPTRQMMKDASTLEEGGLHSEAFDKYSFIYSNYSSAEARVGMRRMAQHILDSKTQKAQMICMTENYDAALTAYEDAISFENSNAALELRSSQSLTDAYAQCKSKYIDVLSGIAEGYVKSDDFENAHNYIRKIFSLDRNNSKAKFLDTMCEILPNYNAGEIAMGKGLYRDAYVYFNEVCRVDAGFRDALKLRDECKTMGTFSVVYKIARNRNVSDMYEDALSASIKGKLLRDDNPFIELLERDDLDIIFQEQQETLTPEFEGETGPESGKLKRARFILSGELVSLEFDESPESKSRCDCGSTFRIYSDKVNCYQFSSSASLKATYRYKLLDAETGKLFKSDVISFNDSDTGKSFKYEIMKKISLTSPTGTRDYDVDLSSMKTPETDALITEQDMLNKMYAYISDHVATALNNFKP